MPLGAPIVIGALFPRLTKLDLVYRNHDGTLRSARADLHKTRKHIWYETCEANAKSSDKRSDERSIEFQHESTSTMSAISGASGLHGVRVPLSQKIYASPDEGRVTGGKSLGAGELAELNAYKAQIEQMEAEFKTRQEEIDASNKLDCNDTYLPNITNLSLESASKMKSFVEIDIEQGLDKGENIYGHYGDKEVNSLKEYLSLLNSYIADKSESSTPPPSTQPSATPETTPDTDIPSTGTPAHSELVAGADPNWKDPVGKSGQDHTFPNITSLISEAAAAIYKQVGSMVQSRDASGSAIHACYGSDEKYSVDTYMSWLAQRAATNIEA